MSYSLILVLKKVKNFGRLFWGGEEGLCNINVKLAFVIKLK